MNKRGQSIIEYTLIAILVILGIVYMGPYVLRSVNSYFKLWDTGVQDSFEETLNQAPVNAIPNIPIDCKYISTTDEGCGGLPGSSCEAGYRQSTENWSPQGCNGAAISICTPDCNCCGLIKVGCGTYPLPTAGRVPSGPPTPIPDNCYYGQNLEISPCDSTTSCPTCTGGVTTGCIPPPTCVTDTSCPMPKCQGLLPDGAVLCPGTGLTEDTSYSYTTVANGSCPPVSSTTKCIYKCDANHIQNKDCAAQYHVSTVCGATGGNCSCSARSDLGEGWSTCTNNPNLAPFCANSDEIITSATSKPIDGKSNCGNPGDYVHGPQCLVDFKLSLKP